MSSEVSTGAGRTARGRIERRQAILDGAFTVFARRGYAQACVKEIAQEAGVAKPTVYNHLTDKESLYREAVEAAADRIGAQRIAVVEQLRDVAADSDPRAPLTMVAHGLLQAFDSEDARAVRQLACAQAAQFPDLAVTVRERTALQVRCALADRLARLVLAGRLRPCDPELAAEHFLVLLTGPLEYRPDAAPDTLGDAAVDIFLRAYGT
ncbi:TetR/AcrR family transcriptional regulator [Streptomyces sp. S3(2020)]|uniref:TetR/AcrR family transcriptional regulator n=1 Tax=Streptomyces sp. S3(2020) TaxID=2732044 RepID=UPI0014877BDB|nr:TetR/AcrR family transcriptional regulator [Streptomyces sp. S3(2020)]NNN29311.1 TetR/AcrR family transcriptional regulator [Streptomyces sp. S3(2020)]